MDGATARISATRRMHSRVVVVARRGSGGATELTTVSARGALAVRRTGPTTVHLVGTAAGPIGDDEVDVEVLVGAGASLTVDGVAATIALPGRRSGCSAIRLRVEVGAGGDGRIALPPLVVTERAAVATSATVTVADDGRLDLLERVQLGRHGEPGGQWTGRLVADLDGHAALRQTQRSAGLLSACRDLQLAAPTGPVGAARDRAGRCGVVSRLVLGSGGDIVEPATAGGAYVVPLAVGGALWCAVGVDLPAAEADLAGLGIRC